ncbi:MAG TPA: hypothetical protein VNP72_07210 [Longimicrobium sp.]|nr:hypothetical protein [Longimicrobium sp.]
MSADLLDRRVLGAVRFLDAVTGDTIDGPLRVSAPGVRWARNRRGWWVVVSAPGLEAHTAVFPTPPAQPPLGSIAVPLTVEDAGGRYLPRRFTLALPRDPNPRTPDKPTSLFRPADVVMYASPSGPVAAGWAVVRVSVSKAGVPAAGALLRVVRKVEQPADAPPVPLQILGWGMADQRGEALVAVAGIPVTTWDEGGDGQVLATEVDARVQVFWDPAQAWPPDPDTMTGKGKKGVGAAAAKLAAGRVVAVNIALKDAPPTE